VLPVTGGLGIEVRAVTKRFGAATALDRVDLSVAPGEFVTVIGPSGCGKTTLLRIVAGLEEPDGGAVTIGSSSPAAARSGRRLGYVPQAPALLPWRTVKGNARLLTDVHGRTRPLARAAESGRRGLSEAAVDELLGEVGLADRRGAYPHELSGGMQQRVALVRAFALDAPVLLMDEPFAALDEITRAEMRYLLLRLCERRNVTVVFVTHSIAEAVMLSDRVVVMTGRPGRIDTEHRVDLARPRCAAQEETPEFFGHETDLRRALREGGAP
jgi:NitT/TauT family transport system ATP-binding protein